MKPAAHRWWLLPWAAAGVALAFGAWWHDCVLIAASLPLALHAFHASLGRGAPWDAWRVAVRYWLAGALLLLGAVALLVWVAGFMLDWGAPPGHRLDEALAVLALALALAWFGRGEPVPAWPVGALAALAIAAAVGAEVLVRDGVALAPCAFAGGVALAMACLGWVLAHEWPNELLRAGQRR